MTDTSALLPYQQRWLIDQARVKVCLKSRRIGITWATGVDDVINAATGMCDGIYLSSSQDLATEYMLACKEWCHSLGLVHEEDEEPTGREAIDKTGMQVTRLTFASGKRVIAAPSTPAALRGRQGNVTIDECTTVQGFPDLLRAALPMLIWGSSLRLISTADVATNPFMQLVEDIRSGKDPDKSLHVIDFDQALADGFYRRICLKTGQPWTAEGEAKWRQDIIRQHGIFADSELFCKPLDIEGAGWFSRSKFKLVNSIRDISPRPPAVKRAIRFWDLAATEPSPVNPDPDYTVGARVLELSDGNYLIDDIVRLRRGPAEVEAEMVAVAQDDGRDVEVGTWQDPGAAGKSDAQSKGRALTGYVYHAPKAAKSKVDFGKVWASLVDQGRVYILDREWTEPLLLELQRFPGGSHDDQADAISGAFEVLVTQGAYAGAWASAWGM